MWYSKRQFNVLNCNIKAYTQKEYHNNKNIDSRWRFIYKEMYISFSSILILEILFSFYVFSSAYMCKKNQLLMDI